MHIWVYCDDSDGMNEKGFAVGVLKLDGKPTLQSDAGKIHIPTTVAMRMLLDRVATVDDAIKMLEEYNMSMDFVTADASFHYFMADAGGNYAILEYVDPTEGHPGNPYKMEVLSGNDTLRCVTNFYVSDTMLDSEYGGKSDHGRLRYDIMRGRLKTILSHPPRPWTCFMRSPQVLSLSTTPPIPSSRHSMTSLLDRSNSPCSGTTPMSRSSV